MGGDLTIASEGLGLGCECIILLPVVGGMARGSGVRPTRGARAPPLAVHSGPLLTTITVRDAAGVSDIGSEDSTFNIDPMSRAAAAAGDTGNRFAISRGGTTSTTTITDTSFDSETIAVTVVEAGVSSNASGGEESGPRVAARAALMQEQQPTSSSCWGAGGNPGGNPGGNLVSPSPRHHHPGLSSSTASLQQQQPSSQTAAGAAAPSAAPARRLRVLAAEDDPMLRRVLAMKLRAVGWDATLVADGVALTETLSAAGVLLPPGGGGGGASADEVDLILLVRHDRRFPLLPSP